MNCLTLEFIFGIIFGAILIPLFIALVNWLMKRNKENKETDKKTYQEHFKYEYEQLFEEEKFKNKNFESGENYFNSISNNFNSPDILSFCNRLLEFRKKENKFKRCKVNKQLKEMELICKRLNELTNTKYFFLENIEDDSGYVRIYNENKELFETFRKNYIVFYKLIFDTY